MGGLVAILLLLGACSSGGGDESASDNAPAADGGGVLASVRTIDPQVSVQAGAGATAEPVTDERDLVQGDQVQTNAAGFGEITFFDGSWQRIESNTSVAMTELVDIEDGHVVRTGLDQGKAWNRVGALAGDEDAYAVDTPVAVASVRGTQFSIGCTPAPVVCTFQVVDGTVELAVSSGQTVTLNAGMQLVVDQDQPLGTPESVGLDALEADPWIAKNLALDRTDAPDPPGSAPGAGSGTTPVPQATGEFAADAADICERAGAENAAIALDSADEQARQQAVVLASALDELQALTPAPEVAEPYALMIARYRTRVDLVNQALASNPDQRRVLVDELNAATADGAAAARSIGLEACALRTN
jgi:hypothetical protein